MRRAPACTYTTVNEPPLKYRMLAAMDGNESLKRIHRTREAGDARAAAISIERRDGRSRAAQFIVEEAEVERYRDEVKKRGARKRNATDQQDEEGKRGDGMHGVVEEGGTGTLETSTEGSPVDGIADDSPCTDRWSNLSDDATKRMWGVFDETGIFLAACRHGVAIALCDMRRSGEL